MELRRLCVCLAFFVLAVVSHCSEARHSLQRRGAEEYDDTFLNDEGSDDGAQNDDGGNDADEDEVTNSTILTQPADYKVIVGKTVRLECKVWPEDNVVVEWRKDGEKYFIGRAKTRGSDRYSIAKDSLDLIISDIKPEDSGKYECEVMQVTPVSITHTLFVEEPPRVIRFMATNNGVVVEGSDLLLTCDTTGSPKPEIIWSREHNGGNEKLSEKHGKFSANTFFAEKVNADMSGVYYCYAVNPFGSHAASINVVVLNKPHVHVHRTVVNADIGVEAELQCSVHQEAAPHIRWYKDGMLIEDSSEQFIISTNGSSSTLTVTPRVDLDFGTFTCEAENENGKHNRSIDLVESPVVENFQADGPRLSWTVHSHQPLENIEIQLKNLSGEGEWTTIKVPLPEMTGQREYHVVHDIQDKSLTGRYEATVKVKNTKSWSKHTPLAVVDIESQALPIQTASVFGGSGAYSTQPTTAVLSTVLMYLLVRML